MSDVNWGNYTEAYKAIHDKLDEVLTKLDYPADPAVQDVIDRADRVLGRVYGSQGQQLKQRASTHELMVQLVHQGVEYQAGGGGGSGLVQCQIRNEGDDAWINEPFARKVTATAFDIRNLGSGDVPDLSDRTARLLGIIYGDQGQLLQRITTRDLLIQLRHSGVEIDPRQIRALTSDDEVAVVSMPNVVQAAKDRSIQREGTPTRVNITASGEIVVAPGAGKKLCLCGFVLAAYGDETVEVRWNGADGAIIAAIPTKGILGMNLVGIAEESGENQNLYITKSGSGNLRGTVWTKEVSV